MLKKTKLRHSEYYDSQKVFDELYANSRNGNNFYKLMDLISSNDNIRLAYRNIKTNKGSKTAGVDGLTIKDIQKLNDLEVIAEVQKRLKNYQPKAVKRVFIPKEGTDKKRPLGIPTIWDRLIQQCILQILEPICEAKFHPHSYGFRPNRSSHHAFSRVVSLINIGKQHYCVDIDIKGFFDNVNHGKLLKQMWTLGIRDKAVLSVISKLLKAEIMGEGIPTKGTPQGGILSPLLSNIVLNELDWWVSNQWETYKPNKRSIKGFSQYARTYTKLKGGYIVRYADDFKIMCRTYTDAKRFYHATVDFLEKRLGLEVSPEKSKVVNLKKNSSDFLGFKLKAVPQKKAKYGVIVKTGMADKAKKRVQHTLKQRIKDIQSNPIAENVLRYNVTLVGIQNYYQYATTIYMDLTDIHHALFKVTRARLSRYAKIIPFSNTNETFRRKARGIRPQTKIYTVQGAPMLPTTCVHHKNPWNFSQDVCNYTEKGRAKVHREQKAVPQDVLQQVRRTFSKSRSIEYNDNRISKYIMQYGKCYVLKEDIAIDSVRCHHIVPIKYGGSDKFQNLVIVDEMVHRLIHMSNPLKITDMIKRLSLNTKQLTKLNYLRKQAKLEPINL